MNQTSLLIGQETRYMWKEFKYSLRRSLTILLIFIVVAMILILFAVLEVVLSALFNLYPATLQGIINSMVSAGITTQRISDIAYLVLTMFFLSSLIRGLLSSSFGWLFTRADENIIGASPIAPHALFAAKKFKRFLIHTLTVATLIFAVLPLVWRIGFAGFQLIDLFVMLLAFIEIQGFVENITYSLFQMARAKNRSTQVLGVILLTMLILFVSLTPFLIFFGGGAFVFLDLVYPPYLLSRMLMLNLPIGIMPGTLLLVGEGFVFALVASIVARFGLRRWASHPRLIQTRGSYLRLRKDRLQWKASSKNDVNLIFMKDFWVTVRNPARFFVPLGITLILLLFLLQFQIMFLGGGMSTSVQYTDPIFILSTYLVSILVLPPAWDSFASERRTLFILKTAPIDPRALINGKYLFALMKSALYLAPIVVTVSFLMPHSWNISFIALEVTLVLLVSNAVAILASVSYPPAYRGVGPPPFLVVLGLPFLCAVLTMIIPITFILSYTNSILFAMFSIPVIAYVFIVMRWCLRRAVGSFIKLQES